MRTPALLLALLLTACPAPVEPPSDGGRPPECETRDDCPSGKICTAEKFCDDCSSSGQCRLKEQCNPEALLCELRAGWGIDCASNDQCQAGAWCKQGLCTDRSEVSLCPGGANAECPQGYRCNVPNGVCEEDLGCSDNGDCGAAEVCNTGSHACVPRCTVDTQSQVCAGGEKCADDHCVQCATAADCGVGLTCDAAGKCTAGQRCYLDRDCKVPLVCYVQTGACLSKLPPCISDENCPADKRCYVGAGKCIPRTCQPDRYEANNDPEHAFGITASRYTELTLCQGDVDYYALPLARGDQLGVNVDADPFSESTFSTVVKDATGRTLSAGRLLVSYVAPAPATYYVAISSQDAYQPYDVTFLLSRGTPCDDDLFEPNDAPAQATAVNAASSVDGAICPQDQDHFALQVPAGLGVKTQLLNYSSGGGLLRLCLFDATGATELGCSDDPFLPVVTLGAATAGGKKVLARIGGSTERISNSYTLKVEFP
ncbi:MAG: hypothetical protein ACYC8T_14115 [Myxococcaceae bacterium]